MTTRGTPSTDEPFRLLVLGDFSGRASRGVAEPLAGRRPVRVDRDDLDEVLSKQGARLALPTRVEGQRLELTVRSLEDLHPDALWSALPVFEELRSLRGRLSDPETFAAAAAEMRTPSTDTPPDEAPKAAPDTAGPSAGADLLEAALAQTDAARASAGSGSELVDAIVRDLVMPRVPATPGQTELIASVDEAAAEEMRGFLRAPDFRRLEATWRSLEMLVRRVETDALLQLWILDVTPGELVGDLIRHEDPRRSDTWRVLFEPDAAADAPRWAAWAALELTFGASPTQAALLARIGRLAAAAGTPFLAGAHESAAGCPSIHERPDPEDWEGGAGEAEEAWAALAARPEMAWVLLALPRLLLRAPYGASASPTERFRFEEVGESPGHEDFLWGSGVLGPALALAQEFAREGWALSPNGRWELERMPVPLFRDEDGERAVKPCAETLLSGRAASALRARGFTPIATVRDSDRARLGPLTSVAGTPLAGRWPA